MSTANKGCIGQRSYKTLAVFFTVQALLQIATLGIAFDSDAILEDFDSNSGWNLGYHGVLFGSADIDWGYLHISHQSPVTTFHAIWMLKDYHVNFVPNTWVHFRMKVREMLLGADAYADFYLDGQLIADFGFNGEQHWTPFQYCLAKEWDDEWFIGSPIIIGEVTGKNTDIRVALSDHLQNKVKYSGFHIFSVKYDVNGIERRLRFYVDGRETGYRDLDCFYPEGTADNRIIAGWQPTTATANILRVQFSSVTDGNIYANTSMNDGWGVRWLHAFTDICPAVPHPTTPFLSTKKPSDMYWDYLIVCSPDSVGQINSQIKNMIYQGRMAASTAIYLELLTWQQGEIFSQWMSQTEIDDVRSHPLGSSTFGTHGFIAGKVSNAFGSPLAGASVYTTSGSYSGATASDGSFMILAVDPGTYTLCVSKSGYKTATRSDVAVVPRDTTQLDISLEEQDPVPTGTVVVNSGSACTDSPSVTLTLSVSPDGSATEMRFMNSGSSWTAWEPYAASRQWTLTSGNGNRIVYAQFRNDSGTSSSACSDSILLDTVAPTAPGKPTYLGAFTDGNSIAFAWSASMDGGGSGIAGYICQIGSMPGGDDIHSGDIEEAFEKALVGAHGNHYYCRVRAVDNAGNMSGWAISSDGITVVEHVVNGVAEMKAMPDLESVGLPSTVVSAVFADCFYIEDVDRAAGIRVEPVAGVPTWLAIGSTVDIGGVLKTTRDGERLVESTVAPGT